MSFSSPCSSLCFFAFTLFADTARAADVAVCLNGDSAGCESSLHLLQKSATVLKKQASVSSVSYEGNLSTNVPTHGTPVHILSKFGLGLLQSRRAVMNPVLFKIPFFTEMMNFTAVAVPQSAVTTMNWYNYVLCGIIALNILGLIVLTWKGCAADSPEQEYTEGEESDGDYTVAKYVGLILAVIDANDWMVFTFFPTWCIQRGLTETDSGVIMAMMGVGLLVGAPFVQFMIARVGSPNRTLWYGNRFYAMTRVLCIALIFVPQSMLFLVSCVVFFITGFCWSVDEVSASAWVLISVPGEKRAGAMGYMIGGRLLGSLIGPGLGGLLFSLGGLWLPFTVGLVLLLAIQQYGKALFQSTVEYEQVDAFAKGSILRHIPIFLMMFVYTVVCGAFCCQMMWQQLWMIDHYHMSSWEYGIEYTIILIIMACFMAIVVAQVDSIIGSVPAVIFGLLTMGTGYLIIGPSSLLPFLSTTQVWIPIVGSLIWAIGIAFPMVVLNSFVVNVAVGAGWPESEATIQWSTLAIVLTGIGLMFGAPLTDIMIARLGVGQMCTSIAFVVTCCCGALMCMLYCVKHKDASRAPKKPVK